MSCLHRAKSNITANLKTCKLNYLLKVENNMRIKI